MEPQGSQENPKPAPQGVWPPWPAGYGAEDEAAPSQAATGQTVPPPLHSARMAGAARLPGPGPQLTPAPKPTEPRARSLPGSRRGHGHGAPGPRPARERAFPGLPAPWECVPTCVGIPSRQLCQMDRAADGRKLQGGQPQTGFDLCKDAARGRRRGPCPRPRNTRVALTGNTRAAAPQARATARGDHVALATGDGPLPSGPRGRGTAPGLRDRRPAPACQVTAEEPAAHPRGREAHRARLQGAVPPGVSTLAPPAPCPRRQRPRGRPGRGLGGSLFGRGPVEGPC